jgi:hypothetical protein
MYYIENILNWTTRGLGAVFICIALSGCVGTVIETAADATLAVAKTPFKIGGAIVDVVAGEDDD